MCDWLGCPAWLSYPGAPAFGCGGGGICDPAEGGPVSAIVNDDVYSDRSGNRMTDVTGVQGGKLETFVRRNTVGEMKVSRQR